MEKLLNPRAASFPFPWSPQHHDWLRMHKNLPSNKNTAKGKGKSYGTFGYEALAAPSLFFSPQSP